MVVFLEHVAADVIVGIWKFDDALSLDDVPAEVFQEANALCEARKREVAATYSLLRAMTSDGGIVVRHNSSGKPFVEGWNISISHTRGFASVILSRNLDVAIDMEYIDPRVNRIVHKFLRKDESPSSLFSRIIHWCAKETMYKLFSDQHLALMDIRVLPFLMDEKSGEFIAENLQAQQSVTLHYSYNADYVMVYAFCEKQK